MLDLLAQHASASNLGLAVVLSVALWLAYKSVSQEIAIRRRGGHAPRLRGWVPFGIDLVYEMLEAGRKNENLQMWDKVFMMNGNENNPYTVETYTGGQRIIFTADPENVKAILATQFNDYGKGPRFNRDWHPFLGDSIFSTDHEKWHQSRQLIRPQFIKDRVSDLETFERHVEILLPLLKGEGQVVDVKDLFFRYTLDAATDFLLGRSADSLVRGETEFAWAFAEIQRIQNSIARAGPLNFVINRTEFNKHIKVLNGWVEPYIDETLRFSPAELEKRSKGDHGYTFLHALASYTRDRKVLRDQLVAVLLAGRDTTACTLSWLFYELSKQPELVTELREEIERQVGFERMPTYNDLKSMKCLQHVMNETLRLYPVVPYNIRVALKDTTLPHGGGKDGNSPVGILSGTPVGYSTHYMQLRDDMYPPISEDFSDPMTFDAHRWDNWQPKPWTYIPFNGGPRLCVGQQFALTEMGYTIVRILQKFSRIDCHVPVRLQSGETPPPRTDGGIQGVGGKGVSSVKKIADTRDLLYKSEIVLQPVDAVKLAFWE